MTKIFTKFWKRPPVVEFFQGKNEKWFFHLLSSNGQISAASQGYSSKGNAKRAARKLYPELKFKEGDK